MKTGAGEAGHGGRGTGHGKGGSAPDCALSPCPVPHAPCLDDRTDRVAADDPLLKWTERIAEMEGEVFGPVLHVATFGNDELDRTVNCRKNRFV